MTGTIRPTLTIAEAEALLVDPAVFPVDPAVKLRARGKLSTALLALPKYDPPMVRARKRAGAPG